jgi:hypothetical protein
MQLLKRRVLTMKDNMLEPETVFLARLKSQCGSDYTKRMDQLIGDRATSRRLSLEFSKSHRGVPRYCHFLVFSSENWQTLGSLTMKPPDAIARAQHLFGKFYRSKIHGRRLVWNLQLSDVKLGISNLPGVQKIACSGDYATVLLALRGRRTSITEIANAVEGRRDDVEATVHALASTKAQKLLLKRGSEVSVNTKAQAPDGVLRLHVIVQGGAATDAEKLKTSIAENQDLQIDAAIVFTLKSEKSMDMTALRDQIKQKFANLEDAVFEARLAKLQSKEYIRLEPSGKVHYLP